MRNKIIAGLATLACTLGIGAAVAAPAFAGQQYAQAGAFREDTDLCLAWYPNTCHGVALVSWSGPGFNPVVGQYYRFTMIFRGYQGSREVHCYRYLYELSSGAYWQDYSPVACYYS